MIVTKSNKVFKILFVLAVAAFSCTSAPAATYTVTNTDDSGPGSLREAIENANDNSGQDVIAFNIPGIGPHAIQPLTPLPPIADPVVIDGYTQPGAAPATYTTQATLLVELDGSNVDSGSGLSIGLNISAGNSTIRGLVINRLAYAGIMIGGGSGNVIEGNYIGTDVTGTIAQGNSDGIRIEDASSNLIGGTSPAARNIISGNTRTGMEILWSGSVGNTVQGNYIGTDATGTAGLGNRYQGIHTYADTYTVIGPGNVVSDNGDSASGIGAGIELSASNQDGYSQVIGNLVGTDVSGTMALGNFCGIRIMGQNWNDVKDNIVSNSEITGIWLGDGMSLKAHNNTITGNTVRLSGGFGIQIEFSNNNLICNNSFIDNQPGLPAVDHGGTGNIFNLDKPLGGNFWSDWTGPDNDHDGFVDSPYLIWTPDNPNGNYSNQDNLPWASQGGWQNGCLIQQLQAEVKKLKLHKGLEESICKKMEEAAKKLDDKKPKEAANLLEASIKEVEAQKDKKIEKDAADELIKHTKEVIEVIEKKK